MTTTIAIEHLVIDPKVRDGRPCIDGTGITVHDIAGDYNNGLTVDYMVEAFDLTPGQVHAALSYYFDHKEQIDQEIHERQVEDDQLRDELIRQSKTDTMETCRKRIEARMVARKTG